MLGSILFAMLLVAFSNLVVRAGAAGRAGLRSAELRRRPCRRPPAAAAAPKETPLPELLAKADAKKGEQDAKVCPTCHTFEKGGARQDRPAAVGRGRASGRLRSPGFAYSDSLKAIGGDWTYEKLDHWIANPKAMASGTKMAFPGEKDPQKDADILAYLQTRQRQAGSVPEGGFGEVDGRRERRGGAALAPTTASLYCRL